MLILRRFRNNGASVNQQEIRERERVVTRLAAAAQANPDALAKIVSAWLNEAETTDKASADRQDDTEATVSFERKAA